MDTKILLEDTYYLATDMKFYRGFVFIEGDKVVDVGSTPLTEHLLSELHYNFNGKAVVFHGFSVVVSPSSYLLGEAGIDISVFSNNEVRGLIKVLFYELLMNGVTLPLIYELDERIVKLVIDVAKMLKIPVAIISKKNILENYMNLIDEKLIYAIDVSHKGIVQDFCIDSIKYGCKYLMLKNILNLNAVIATYLGKMENGYDKVIEVLSNPYRLLSIDNGVIDKNSRSHIIVYDARKPLKAPMIASNPIAILKKGYLPDLVIIDGDIVMEQGIVYIIDENEVTSVLDKISDRLVKKLG